MKSIFTLLIVCLLGFLSFSQYIQLGQDIDGLIGDQSGLAVSLSADGSRVAIASPFNSNTGSFAGAVRVYEYTGAAWVQVGQDIEGVNAQDVFGSDVAISDDGARIVIGVVGVGSQSGAVEVYEYSGASWVLLGQQIVADASNDQFGITVGMNGNGDRVIVGAGSNGSYVKVFDYNGTSWNQVGQKITSQGYVVTIEPAGGVIGIGNPGNSGVVRVYAFDGSTWNQRGNDIIGSSPNSHLGTAISINTDGGSIAVGIPGDDIVRMYSYSTQPNQWVQVGQDITGYDNAGDDADFGSISLTPGGDFLAIASRYSNTNGNNSGDGRVFQLINNIWTQIGNTVVGEASGDEMGKTSISDDGARVAFGARKNDGGGLSSGHVRVYENIHVGLEGLNVQTIAVYPNPGNGDLNIKSDVDISCIDVYDYAGRVVSTFDYTSQINLNLKEGVYFLKLRQESVVLESIRIIIM